MGTSYTKLSNVIGAPFSDAVLTQLYIRAAHNSSINRTNEEVLFLANKTGWARLVSSVNITLSNDELRTYYTALGIVGDAALNKNQDTLAKNWILEAGTSKAAGNGIDLRAGIGPDGAYGLGGTEELGYRPMPGLTSVQIETTGRLGSLRQATINFKVWNMNQLNIVEALYFRLGYSMLLEWGHTQYFQNQTNTLKTDGIYGIDDPFAANLRKEGVQQAIARKVNDSSSNYDGMLGIVSNFTWAFNQEGGYDCTVRLVGLGAVMDSTRINQTYKLPDGAIKEFKKNQDILQLAEENARLKKQLEDEAIARSAAAAEEALRPKPKVPPASLNDLYEYARKLDDYLPNIDTFTASYQYYPNANPETQETTTTVPDYYYQSTAKGRADQVDYNKNYFGLFTQKNGAWWKRFKTSDIFSLQNVIIDKAAKYFVDIGSGGDVDYYALPKNQKTGRDYSLFGRVVSVLSRTPVVLTETISGNSTIIELDDPITDAKVSFINEAFVGPTSNSFKKQFQTTVSFANQYSANYAVTRRQIFDAFDEWYTSAGAGLVLREITPEGSGITQSVKIRSTVDILIPQVKSTGLNKTYPLTKDLTIKFTIEFNNTAYINQLIGDTITNTPTQQQTQTANSGDENGTANQAGTSPVESTTGYESALHAMLVLVQTQCQKEALNISQQTGVLEVDIAESTDKFYNDGSLNGIFTAQPAIPENSNGIPFNLLQYGLKGYNSSLMYDSKLFDIIPSVDFNQLSKAYVVKYTQGGAEGTPDMIHSPVYIRFGYLLAFLNNICLIYDSTEKKGSAGSTANNEKRPYIYIDFNPETNFCLTSPQQFSVDPFTCLIPLNATKEQYLSVYPPNIASKINTPLDPETENIVSNVLQSKGLQFKANNQAYQGKTMNILLNVGYLLGIINEYASSDAQHGVYLQPFLERILTDVNKSLGNMNSFRVAYRDDSNTVQIQDDQWVPSLVLPSGVESSIMSRTTYLSKLKTNPQQSGQLPIFGPVPGQLPVAGAQSLARQFQLKTTMSTKLASMIAISAQAETGSVNATDHSSLSYLNLNKQDRYKKHIQDQSTPENSGTNTNSKSNIDGASNDQKVADMFNEHIKSIYYTLQLSADKVDLAKNYYIERMSKTKSDDPVTSAAPFIPADLEMTIDGISGIIMGNAFTIPEDRLPLSLRGENGFTKVAFIVTGLTHTIESNEWLTRIKGQMIKLRNDIKVPTATTLITQVQNTFVGALPAGTINGPAIDTTGNAAIIIKFLKSKGFSDVATAAAVGSFQQESGLNPAVVNINPKLPYNTKFQTYAAGIAQWVGPRRVRLLKYAKSQGIIIQGYNEAVAIRNNETKTPQSGIIIEAAFRSIDLNTQLNFLAIEIAEYPNFNTFKTTTDLQYALKWIYVTYEGGNYTPGAAFGGRGDYAAGILKSIQAGQV
jgi:hypothetical protein